jgi:SagB-type dehydrogenase family enzyme
VVIRRSRALVLTFDGSEVVAQSFLARGRMIVHAAALHALLLTADWAHYGAVAAALSAAYGPGAVYELDLLIGAGMILVADSALAEADRSYERRWTWGETAGFYHFGMKDPVYMSPEQVETALCERIVLQPQVPLYQTNDIYAETVPLPQPSVAHKESLLSIMRRRRSWRGHAPDGALSRRALATCLFAGGGITGFANTPLQGMDELPVKTSPSGGARNPYELVVYARRVAGLAPGFYHYSGTEHTLGLVSRDTPSVGELLAGQPWFDHASAVVLLVAYFERTMWKYPHPTGYRVVLIEAGHIAQNIILTATALGLASAPTCALSDSAVSRAARLASITTSAVYAVALGVPSREPTVADITNIRWNPLFAE